MSLLIPSGAALPPARRLVVLVPDADLDETGLTRRIWTLAAPRQLEVLYLGLCRATSDEPRARRRLATIAALTRDDCVNVRTVLVMEADWLRSLRPLVQTGDLIVCHVEQLQAGWRRDRPLGPRLSQALKMPVYTLEGFYAGARAPTAGWMGRLIFWGGSVGIVAVAFWLQVRIGLLPKDWAQSLLMILSVVGEFSLIGLWNKLFN
jgi:hypothetical protein